MKFASVVVALACMSSLSVKADAESEMVFTAKPSFTSDSSGNFTGCGIIISTEKAPTQFSEGVGFSVKLTFTKRNLVSVQAVNYTLSDAKSEWKPSPKIIKWIKIGSGRPIALDPYNLITNKAAGLSEFTTKDDDWDTLVQLSKNSPTVWVEFYLNNDRFQYSGELKANANTYKQLTDCIASLDKSYGS